jgi:hypothetical protein
MDKAIHLYYLLARASMIKQDINFSPILSNFDSPSWNPIYFVYERSNYHLGIDR